ncbi:aminomethyltransferase beta-barrel domain-containing protein [Escherichia coli]
MPCLIQPPIDDETIRVIFDEKQAAVTPGRSAVFYDGEVSWAAASLSSVCRCRSDYYLYLKQGSSERGKELL